MANSIMKRAWMTYSEQHYVSCSQEVVTVAVVHEEINTSSLVVIIYLELRVECLLRI